MASSELNHKAYCFGSEICANRSEITCNGSNEGSNDLWALLKKEICLIIMFDLPYNYPV